MKLPTIKDVLFDEFPCDDTVKYCIFTQPKFPDRDYSEYKKNVIYCGNETTLSVMRCFRKLSIERFLLLSERRTRLKTSKPLGIRAIPSGNVSDSVMFLIEIDDTITLYTGQFTECRSILLSQIVLYYKNRIDDIYVDNTMAALTVPTILHQATEQIKEIVSKNKGYKIFLHMELFGYEELLYELARSNIKIQLNNVQSILFENLPCSSLFKFDGPPQITVYARFREERAFEALEYKTMFESIKILHVKLAMSQHRFREPENIKGVIFVPYTPHPGAYDLSNLFQTVQSKRIHPLVKASYAEDPMSVIPDNVLNNGCAIIGYELNEIDECEFDCESKKNSNNNTSGARSFLAISDENMDDWSVEVSDIVFDLSESDDSHASDNDNENENKGTSAISSSVNAIKRMTDDIIAVEDDGEDDDLLDLFETSHKKNENIHKISVDSVNAAKQKTDDIIVVEDDDISNLFASSHKKDENLHKSPINSVNTAKHKTDDIIAVEDDGVDDDLHNLFATSHNNHKTDDNHVKVVNIQSQQSREIPTKIQKTSAISSNNALSKSESSSQLQKSLVKSKMPEKSSIIPSIVNTATANATKLHERNKNDANNNDDVLSINSDHTQANQRGEISKVNDKSSNGKMSASNIQRGNAIKRKTAPISPQRFHRIQRIEYLSDSDEENENDKLVQKEFGKQNKRKSIHANQYEFPPKKKSKAQSSIDKDQITSASCSPNNVRTNCMKNVETDVRMKSVNGTQIHASTGNLTSSKAVIDQTVHDDRQCEAKQYDVESNTEFRLIINEYDSDSDSSDAYVAFPD